MEPRVTSPAAGSEGSSTTVEYKFQDQDRSVSVLTGLSTLYENKQFTDVILVVGDQDFYCHRNVLAISSPFFMAMFTHDMTESHQLRIPLKEMDGNTMKLVLDYIYRGQVYLSEDTVQNLLSAANLFQMIPLRNGCAEFMMQHVTMSNCIGIYFFAKAHHCEALATKANEIIHRNFQSLCREQEFLLLPAEQLKEVLRDDSLNVSREEVVYEACLAWLGYNMYERRRHLVDILKCVRFANISSYYFCDKVDCNSLLKDNKILNHLLNNVKYFHVLKNRQNEIDLNYVPRRGMGFERGIIIIANPYSEDTTKKFNSMELLVPRTGTIHHLCKLPQSLYMPGACITGDNQLYMAGGAIRKINYRGPFSAEGVSSNLFMYDKTFGSWQVKAKMSSGRSQFALAVIDGSIIAVGGQNENSIIDSVEVYDPYANSWSVRTPLPQPVRCMTSVAYKGSLYVFGGETEKEITRASYRYDLADDSWLELPPMQTARALAGSVVYRNQIYVIGGNSSISTKWRKELLPEHCVSSVEIFDPAEGTWKFGPELPNALCGAGCMKYGDTLMVVGGEDDKSWMAGLFELKERPDGTEYWVEGRELPTVMSTFGCVVANISKELIRQDI